MKASVVRHRGRSPRARAKECVREHDPSLFNIAWESLENAERRERIRDRQKYFLGALMGMMNDRNRERSGR